jgi:general secretion pathway protein M
MNNRTSAKEPSLGALVLQRLRILWQVIGPREQRAVALAAWVVGLALLWWIGLAPAIDTLRQAGTRHAQLDQTLTQMRAQAASAEVLRAQNATPPPGREAAQRALEEATSQLGAGAQLALQGDRATVTMREIAPRALAQWLQQVRINARLLPVQAQIQRAGTTGWSGQIILAGPGLETAI